MSTTRDDPRRPSRVSPGEDAHAKLRATDERASPREASPRDAFTADRKESAPVGPDAEGSPRTRRRRLVSVASGDHLGLEGRPVEVQVDILGTSEGKVRIVGLAGKSTRESCERIRAAIVNSGFPFPGENILVNLAPAAQEKDGAGFDLAVALGILLASGAVSIPGGARATRARLAELGFLGELGLAGEVRSVRGALLAADGLRQAGRRRLVVPSANCAEVVLLDGVEVHAVSCLREAIAALRGESAPTLATSEPSEAVRGPEEDFREVRGQEATKRGLLVAAAGGHDLLLSGPPGVGKTMLARRVPGVLPPLDVDAAMEVLRIRSLIGGEARFSRVPPFRAPHHTVSYAGLVGGGSPVVPGEITRAHRGVLFLDELPEFSRRGLEALREPIEEGRVHIGRSGSSVTFPAEFLLIAAMNPCPCGYLGHRSRACHCSPRQVELYRRRISGPLWDRIDLFVRVASVDPGELVSRVPASGLTSEAMARAIANARERQSHRWRDASLNRRISLRRLLEEGQVRAEALSRLRKEATRLQLSARGFARTLRVARTVADLDGKDAVAEGHVLEALGFRDAGGGR